MFEINNGSKIARRSKKDNREIFNTTKPYYIVAEIENPEEADVNEQRGKFLIRTTKWSWQLLIRFREETFKKFKTAKSAEKVLQSILKKDARAAANYKVWQANPDKTLKSID